MGFVEWALGKSCGLPFSTVVGNRPSFHLCAQSIWSSMLSESLRDAFAPSSAFLPGNACVLWLYPYLFP